MQYPFLRLTISFVLGTIAGSITSNSVGQCLWLTLLLCLLIAGIGMMFIGSRATSKTSIFHSAIGFMAMFMLGGWNMALHIKDMTVSLPVQQQEYKAIVATVPEKHGKVMSADIIISQGSLKGRKVKATLLADETNCPQIGDGIVFISKMQEPGQKIGNFNYHDYLLHHGYVAQTFITPDHLQYADIDITEISHTDRLMIRARKTREDINSKYLATPHNTGDDMTPIIAALTLGDKSQLGKPLKEAYSISGGSHILALSGLHLGILYGLMVMLLGRRPRMWKQAIILFSIWSFVVLVGCSASVVRSAVMLTIYTLLTLMRRSHLSLSTWAMTLFIILLANPWNLWDVGVQMSFMAVFAILVYGAPLQRVVNKHLEADFSDSPTWFSHMLKFTKPLMKWAWGMVAVSLAAQIGVAPLIAYYFHRVSLLFLLTNFLVVPCATVILWLFVLSWPASLSSFCHTLVMNIMYMVVKWMNEGVKWIASLPVASWEGIDINGWQTMGIYAILFLPLFFHLPSLPRIVRDYRK